MMDHERERALTDEQAESTSTSIDHEEQRQKALLQSEKTILTVDDFVVNELHVTDEAQNVTPIQSQPKRAGFGMRLLAEFIDMVLLYLMGLLVVTLVFLPALIDMLDLFATLTTNPSAFPNSTNDFSMKATQISTSLQFINVLYVPIYFLLYVIYKVIFGYFIGTTLGKLICRIVAVDECGSRLTMKKLFYREVVCKYFISFPFFAMGGLMMLWHPQKKTMHDLLMHTTVVCVHDD